MGCAGEGGVAAGHVPQLPPAELHVHLGVHLGVARRLQLAPGAQLVAHHAGEGGGGAAGHLHTQQTSLSFVEGRLRELPLCEKSR